MSGFPCGSNPHQQLTPGDAQAIDEFRDFLEERTQDRTASTVDRARAALQRFASVPGFVDAIERFEAAVRANERGTTADLAPMLEGFGRLLATTSRDMGQDRVDAWLYAVVLGWDCEATDHDETCTHGAMEEMQERHSWDDDTVAKARRYRAAVRALTEPQP